MKSEGFSFENWNVWSFFKGRKKLIVAAIGYGLGLFIADSHTVATLSAAGAEIVYALIEFYVKNY